MSRSEARVVTAALFPGQNSQAVGMARDFYESSAAARRVLDESEAALPGLLDLMWNGPEDVLKMTANQQPALVAAGMAAYAAYREAGGNATYAAGHSLGEFTAHVAAGSLALGDALRLVRKRGEYMQAAVPAGVGAMAAVLKLDPGTVQWVCEQTEGVVEIANLNSPQQTVISGAAGAVAAASEALKKEGARVVPLKVSAPFHCSLMQPAADKLERDLNALTFQMPSLHIVCNVTADVLDDVAHAPDLLKRQVTAPVRWVESVQRLNTLGVTRFLEFGSGSVLTGLVGRILDTTEARTVEVRAVTDVASLQIALQEVPT